MSDTTVERVDTATFRIDALRKLVDAWRDAHGKAPKKPPLTVDPYPGLRSYLQSEASLFFGRRTQTVVLGERFRENNVVLVLGGSGSGKSSLVKAGLMPKLKTISPVPDRMGQWYDVECRPRTDPTRELVEALWQQICERFLTDARGHAALAKGFGFAFEEGMSVSAVREICREKFDQLVGGKANSSGKVTLDPYGVYELANSVLDRIDDAYKQGLRSGPPNVLLLIDQFEEIFDDQQIDLESRSAIAALIDLARCNRGGLFVVLTMRSESLHRCAEDQRLVDVVNQSSFLLELVDERDIEEAIVLPARRVLQEWGVLKMGAPNTEETAPFTTELLATLQDEMKRLRTSLIHKPDSLPLLQHTLEAIWINALARWSGALKVGGVTRFSITNSDYTNVTQVAKEKQGQTPEQGFQGAFRSCLDKRADACLAESKHILQNNKGIAANDAERIVASVFATLARRDDRGNWVREFATLRRLLAISGTAQARGLQEAEIEKALEPFVRTGYLQADKKSDGQTEYNVSHEALVRSWAWARSWLERAEKIAEALGDADRAIESRNRPPTGKPTLMDKIWLAGSQILAPFGWLVTWRQSQAANLINPEQQQYLQNVAGRDPLFAEQWAVATLARLHNESARRRMLAAGEPLPAIAAETAEAGDFAKRRYDGIVKLCRDARAWRAWGRPLRVMEVFTIVLVGYGLVIVYLGSEQKATELANKVLAMVVAQTMVNSPNLSDVYKGLSDAPKGVENWPQARVAFDQFYYTVDVGVRRALRRITTASSIATAPLLPLPPRSPSACLKVGAQLRLEVPSGNEARGVFDRKAGVAPGLYLFVKRPDGEQVVSRQLSVQDGGIVCLSADTRMLLQWNARSLPEIVPLTWLSVSGGPGNDTWQVITHVSSSIIESNNIRDVLSTIDHLTDGANASEKGLVQSFNRDGIRGFEIGMKGGGHLYLASAVAINEPERVGSVSRALVPSAAGLAAGGTGATRNFKDCVGPKQPAREGPVPRCEVAQLSGDQRTYRLVRTLVTDVANGLLKDLNCRDNRVPCQQSFELFPTGQTGASAPRFTKSDHVSASIDGATIEDGYLYLRDEANTVWRYALEFPQLKQAIETIDLTREISKAASTQQSSPPRKGGNQ
jgi:hypothetical protein